MIALLACLAGAEPSTPAPAPPPAPKSPEATVQTIAIEGIVTAWKVGAMRDHSEDSFAVYDAAEIRVTAPPEQAGKLVTLYAEQPSAPDLVLRETGAAVGLSTASNDIKQYGPRQ